VLSNLVPVKTPEGHQELAQRVRRLSQRHRTLLLLVDGRRTVQQVLQMATAAGVPGECFEELLSLGLVVVSEPADGSTVDLLHVGLPLAHEDSVLPASATLLPESEHGDLGPPVFETQEDTAAADPRLEEARELLVRALRNEAPVTGSLTLMKLRRAATREEVEALLDEVEQRIRKPRKQLIVAQLMRQVKHLLSLPPLAS
jgi:hypothetical protein